MESDDLDVRDADTIRKECDKHEWQDHLITKLVRRNTSNLIHRMASRLRHVDKADFDYVLPEVIHKQSIITGTMINTRIMKTVNEEAKSPNPVDRILLSPLSSNRKQHSFLDMIDRRRDKQMVGENIETKKSDASQEAMYAAIQLESLTKDKVHRSSSYPIDIPTSELLDLVQGFLHMKKFARKDREFLKQHLKTRVTGHLLRELFWYAHNNLFNDHISESQREENANIIKQRICALYIKVTALMRGDSTRSMTTRYKDMWTKYVPTIMSTAIFYGFYFLCPLSRVLFDRHMHKRLTNMTYKLLTGMKPCNYEKNFTAIFRRTFASITEDPPEFLTEARERSAKLSTAEYASLPLIARMKNDKSHCFPKRSVLSSLINIAAASSHKRRRRKRRIRRLPKLEKETNTYDHHYHHHHEEEKRKTRRELRLAEISPVIGNFLGGDEMSSELAATLKGRKLFRTIPAPVPKDGHFVWSQVGKNGYRLRKTYQNVRRSAETESQQSRHRLTESLRDLREEERKTLQSDRADLAKFASMLE